MKKRKSDREIERRHYLDEMLPLLKKGTKYCIRTKNKKATRQQFLRDADGFCYDSKFRYFEGSFYRVIYKVIYRLIPDKLAVYLQSGSFFQFVGIPILWIGMIWELASNNAFTFSWIDLLPLTALLR